MTETCWKLYKKRFGDDVRKPKKTGKKIEPGISWTRGMIDEELPDLSEFKPAAAENTEVSDKSDEGEDLDEEPDVVMASLRSPVI